MSNGWSPFASSLSSSSRFFLRSETIRKISRAYSRWSLELSVFEHQIWASFQPVVLLSSISVRNLFSSNQKSILSDAASVARSRETESAGKCRRRITAMFHVSRERASTMLWRYLSGNECSNQGWILPVAVSTVHSQTADRIPHSRRALFGVFTSW